MKKHIYISLLFIFVIGLWTAYPFIISQQFVVDLFPKEDWISRGVVGDSFGALNTLFSGLALAGLAVNIYLQSVQLKKLEAKEEENSSKIKSQSEIASITALIQYFNSEIEQTATLLSRSKMNENDEEFKLACKKITVQSDSRHKLVKRLAEKLELPVNFEF
jgi:hypothetical protein